MLICLLLPVAVLADSPAEAETSEAPAAETISQRFGIVSSHLARFGEQDMEAEFQAMDEIHAGWVRCSFAWHDLEWQGDNIWDFTDADIAVQKAQDHGVEILGILGGCPAWANGSFDPRYPPTPQNLDKWADYVRTVCSRYAGKVAAWEIWNEENILFWMPEPDPQYYVELLGIASGQIREVDPQAKVVMGGMAGLGADYLHEAFAAGALAYVDAIAYHPYANTIGETTDPPEALYWPKEKLCRNIVDKVRDDIRHYEPTLPIEVWVTEVGWSASDEGSSWVDPDTQAAYILRTMINYASTNLDKCFIYMMRDEPETFEIFNDPAGLMEYDFTRKPSYYYYKTFEEVFGEANTEDAGAVSFTCSDPDTLEAHCFPLPDGNLALAAWKSDNLADTLSFTVEDTAYTDAICVDPLTGNGQSMPGVSRDEQGRLNVQGVAIGKTPVIIKVGKLITTSITVNQAMQHTTWLDITVEGITFEPGSTVRLEKGSTVIEAFDIKLVSNTHIIASVGSLMIEPGVYDLVITNPDGVEVRLNEAFTVTSTCGAGAGVALLAFGLMLGLLSAAGFVSLRSLSRRK